MNYRGHLWGGFFAGAVSFFLGFCTQSFYFDFLFLKKIFESPDNFFAYQKGFLVFFTAWASSIFPDLDTSSLPQRWFFRILLLALICFLLLKKIEIFIFLSLLMFVFVIDKHRGWTHWKGTPWILVLIFVVFYDIFKNKSFSVERIFLLLKENWIFVFAVIFGHYFHLILDSRFLRRFSFLFKKLYR